MAYFKSNFTSSRIKRWFDIKAKRSNHSDRFTVSIESCPINSYRLTGDNIGDFWEESLRRSNQFYLEMYDKVYRDLMKGEFNPIWTPDTTAVNDLDFKDDFGSVSYLIFNMYLLKSLSSRYKLEVSDNTQKEFRHQSRLYQFLKTQGIELRINEEKRGNTSFKNRQKKRVLGFFKNLVNSFIDGFHRVEDEVGTNQINPGQALQNDTIYFYVHPYGSMKLDEYVTWRYSDILNEIEAGSRQIIFFSTRDFDDAESFKYPFINVNRLVPRSALLSIFIRSVLLKLRVIAYKAFSILKSSDVGQTVFFNHIPTGFFHTLREFEGLNRLFANFGKGLLFIKGPVNNKGVSILNDRAKKHGIRVSVVQPRFLTAQRLSNQYVPAQYDPDLPDLIPDSMILFDHISTETIKGQTEKIKIYPFSAAMTVGRKQPAVEKGKEFCITLVLQRSDEVREMVQHVMEALEGMSGICLHLKKHPVFKIPKEVENKIAKSEWIKILDSSVTLQDAVESTDLCISSYSSAALDFAAGGCPVIWMKSVTLNSIFFSDVHKAVGIVTRSSKELGEMIRTLKNNPDIYKAEQQKQYKAVRKKIFYTDDEYEKSYEQIVISELEQIRNHN